MDNNGPWQDFNPQSSSVGTSAPWEDFQSSKNTTTPSGFPEPQQSDNPPAGAEVPFEQRLLTNAKAALSGVGTATLAGKLGTSLFSSPQLADAGIRPSTILKMTPKGVNPATTAEGLRTSLNDAGAITSDPADTWNRFSALKDQAGQAVGAARDAIRQQAVSAGGEDPSLVDAQKALKPIYDGWSERASHLTEIGRSYAEPFEQTYSGLMDAAKNQGGKISLDNIKSVMDQVGPLTHRGALESQEAMQQLYGALADAHDGIVESIAKAANNPSLAQTLLDANASFSKYVRIMPDIGMATAKAATQVGSSLLQKAAPWALAGGLGYGASQAKRILAP